MDYIIDVFMHWFSESFTGTLFARTLDFYKDKIKNRFISYFLFCVTIVFYCALGLALTLGLVGLAVFLMIKTLDFLK